MDLNINKEEKIFCVLLSYSILEQFIYQKKFFLDLIPKYFKNFYFVDNSFLDGTVNKFNLKKKINLDQKKYKFFFPKNQNEFLNFTKNKKVTIIVNSTRSWRSLKLFFLLKKVNSNLIQISNIGNIQGTEYKNYKSFYKQNFFKAIPHKLYLLFTFLNLIPKIDIKFISNKKQFLKFKNNFLVKLGLNIFSAKKLILVNSLAYDEVINSKNEINKKYIVMLNTNINHKDAIKFSGKTSKERVHLANMKLKKFLEKISKEFEKEVVICLHPSSNLKAEREIFKKFKVVQFQTKKFIRQAWILFLYETSSVVDAFILNKKIINLENSAMGQNWVNQCQQYPRKTGIAKINIDNDYYTDHINLIRKTLNQKNNPPKYDDFVRSHLRADEKKEMGSTKILKTIKKLYFKDELQK